MADLDAILTGLDETLIAREIQLKVDMALKKFPVASPIVADYPDAEALVMDFYQYLMREMFSASVPDAVARGLVSLLLARAFPAGIEDAADMAVSGVGGGVLALLSTTAEAIKRQLVEQFVAGTISAGVNLASFDDKTALMTAYVSRFATNVPAARQHKAAVQLAAHADEVIKNHMQIASYFRKRLGK